MIYDAVKHLAANLSWHSWTGWKHQESDTPASAEVDTTPPWLTNTLPSIPETLLVHFLQRKKKLFAICCSCLLSSILLPAGGIIPGNTPWVFLAFLDDSHLPEQKQHCSSRGIGGRCERMCKTKCTHAKGRWWSWGLDLPRWTHGLSHFSGSLQWLL